MGRTVYISGSIPLGADIGPFNIYRTAISGGNILVTNRQVSEFISGSFYTLNNIPEDTEFIIIENIGTCDNSVVESLPVQDYLNASGGTETLVGDYKIHTFTGDGLFEVIRLGKDSTFGDEVDYLVVGGGGGGGLNGGGGGGGGGVTSGSFTLPTGSIVYSVAVGAGGAVAVSSSLQGNDGGNSSIFGFTAIGGGGGASRDGGGGGRSGGSGGGGANFESSTNPTGGTAGTGTLTQGYDGGSVSTDNGINGGGAGGGGASSVGSNGGAGTGGNGGAGSSSNITGTTVYYGGGGGGGITNGGIGTVGTGGIGGGGDGGDDSTSAQSGVAGTGGGGGGNGGNGGSGIVIVKYKYK